MTAELNTTAGSKISIGGTIEAATLAEFTDAGRSYIQIFGVSDFSEFGDEKQVVTFETIEDARVRKLSGTADAGTVELTVGRDPLDPGQQALRAALKTKSAYAIKIEMADKPDGATSTPSIYYLKAIVASAKNRLGAANDVTQTVFSLAIDAEPIEVAATVGA